MERFLHAVRHLRPQADETASGFASLIPRFAPTERSRGLLYELRDSFATFGPHLKGQSGIAFSGPQATTSFASPVRCREIGPMDRNGIEELLTRGFERKPGYWSGVWTTLSSRRIPEGFPRFGYLLESDAKPVGVLLLLFASVVTGDEPQIRCNVSSWYVEPQFRSYATILSRRATRDKRVCYFNVTPASHTWTMLKAEGYRPFSTGRVVTAPALSRSRDRTLVQAVGSDIMSGADLPPWEVELLQDHAGYGCLSLICETGGHRYPFVFRSHRRRYGLPAVFLVYCRELSEFVRFAGPIGRFLASRGYFVVTLNSNGPLPGLTGYYRGKTPKFSKGTPEMRPGDLAYSELGMFGN